MGGIASTSSASEIDRFGYFLRPSVWLGGSLMDGALRPEARGILIGQVNLPEHITCQPPTVLVPAPAGPP